MYNFNDDKYGKLCLKEASKSGSTIGFGAVLVKNGEIIGRGRNRRASVEDRILSHVDYAIHAEQDAILHGLKNKKGVRNSVVYVLGKVLHGKGRGTLTSRTKREFGCRKCPHTFIKYNISVAIPMENGWEILSPQEAMETGKLFHGDGKWTKLVKGEIKL